MLARVYSSYRYTLAITYILLTNFRCISNPKIGSIVLNVHLSLNTNTIWSITYEIISVQNHSNLQPLWLLWLTWQVNSPNCLILKWKPWRPIQSQLLDLLKPLNLMRWDLLDRTDLQVQNQIAQWILHLYLHRYHVSFIKQLWFKLTYFA